MEQGIIFYEGPSMIDGQTVAAIATGLVKPSPNVKTGPLVQVYVIRNDMHPQQAIQTGADVSICGTCSLRGKVVIDATGKSTNVGRECYVVMGLGPNSVWRAYRSGIYKTVPAAVARRKLRGRRVRVGAYGDPAAVPETIWTEVLDQVADLTSYTHLWRQFPTLSSFCMASVQSEAERIEAQELGFRTYRIRAPDEPLMKGEGHCPASKEMGNAVTCMECMLCGGHRRPAKADISIIVHGYGKKNFLKETT